MALEARLFPASTALATIKSRRTQADWPAIHRELKRPGVTLRLLWEEHRAAHPAGALAALGSSEILLATSALGRFLLRTGPTATGQ